MHLLLGLSLATVYGGCRDCCCPPDKTPSGVKKRLFGPGGVVCDEQAVCTQLRVLSVRTHNEPRLSPGGATIG